MGNQKQKWTSEEEDALLAGVNKHGPGKWKNILKDPDFAPSLTHRSNIDLKVPFNCLFFFPLSTTFIIIIIFLLVCLFGLIFRVLIRTSRRNGNIAGFFFFFFLFKFSFGLFRIQWYSPRLLVISIAKLSWLSGLACKELGLF